MAHIAVVDSAIAFNRNILIGRDDADFNSPLSFVATLPAPDMDDIIVRETLALLILKEMSAPDNKDEFYFIFGRVEFVLGCADEPLFRSRVLLAFFIACANLNLDTIASRCQIQAFWLCVANLRNPMVKTLVGHDIEVEKWMAWLFEGGARVRKRSSGQFHWSETLMGSDIDEWVVSFIGRRS